MALFCGGYNWDGHNKKQEFIKNNCFEIGWEIVDAGDLYSLLASIKVGDLFCLKVAPPGNSTFRISAVGLVTCSLSKNLIKSFGSKMNCSIGIKWLNTAEFDVTCNGKLTNVRASTLHEEFDSDVINQIINRVF